MNCHIFSIFPFSMFSQILHNWHFHCFFVPCTFYSSTEISRLTANSTQESVRISLLPGKISIISVSPSARDSPKNWKKIKNFLIYELRILLYLNCAINHYLHLELSHLLHFVICTWYVCTKYRTTKIFELMTHQWWRNSWCHIFTEESSG